MTPDPDLPPDRPSCYNCDHTDPHPITGMTWCTVEDMGAGILMTRMKMEVWHCKRWKAKPKGPVRANLPWSQRTLDI